MGEFRAGSWIIGLSIYFFLFFLIVVLIVGATNEVGRANSDMRVDDPGFLTALNESSAGTVGVGSTSASIFDSVIFMAGFGNNVNIGIPPAYLFLASFFLFWIPGLMLIFSLYMILPVIH